MPQSMTKWQLKTADPACPALTGAMASTIAPPSHRPSLAPGRPTVISRSQTMFAVVRTGGKQYRVATDDKIIVEKIDGEAGASVQLETLMFGDAGTITAGGKVTAEIVAQTKGDKVIIFKKRRRHNYRRKNGHRQQLTVLKITSVG
jgi:large subunit ribosomal protein L21